MTQNILMQIDGWKLSCNYNGDFLYLIEFIKDEEIVRSRFDIDKNMFIDYYPAQLSNDDKELLSKLLIEREV